MNSNMYSFADAYATDCWMWNFFDNDDKIFRKKLHYWSKQCLRNRQAFHNLSRNNSNFLSDNNSHSRCFKYSVAHEFHKRHKFWLWIILYFYTFLFDFFLYSLTFQFFVLCHILCFYCSHYIFCFFTLLSNSRSFDFFEFFILIVISKLERLLGFWFCELFM